MVPQVNRPCIYYHHCCASLRDYELPVDADDALIILHKSSSNRIITSLHQVFVKTNHLPHLQITATMSDLGDPGDAHESNRGLKPPLVDVPSTSYGTPQQGRSDQGRRSSLNLFRPTSGPQDEDKITPTAEELQ